MRKARGGEKVTVIVQPKGDWDEAGEETLGKHGARVKQKHEHLSARVVELPASAVEAVLSNRTRWIAVTAASNAVGTVPDLPGIVAAARRIGARVYVDAVHASPHRPHHVADLA